MFNLTLGAQVIVIQHVLKSNKCRLIILLIDYLMMVDYCHPHFYSKTKSIYLTYD